MPKKVGYFPFRHPPRKGAQQCGQRICAPLRYVRPPILAVGIHRPTHTLLTSYDVSTIHHA